MLTTIFHALMILLPLIVLLSGMAMTPVLILMALLVLMHAGSWRQVLAEARAPAYRAIWYVLFAVVGWALLSVTWSITPERSLATALRTFFLCSFGILAYMHVAKLPVSSAVVVRRMSYVAIGVGVITFLELLPSGGFVYQAYQLAGADYERFINKNINRGLCALSVLMWPIVMGLARTQQNRLACVIPLFWALVASISQSLSAQGGMLVGGIAFFLLRYFPKMASQAMLVLLPLFMLSFTTLFVAIEKPVFGSIEAQQVLPQSSLHRVYIWHNLSVVAQQKPWLGWGLDTTRAVPLSQDPTVPEWMRVSPLHPHSPALQIQLELGWVGLIICSLGLYFVLREWQRSEVRGMQWMLYGAMISSYFVAGLSSFGIWQNWWIATLFIALLLARYLGISTKADS